MIIEFTASNFRSFKDPVTISMEAANLTAKDHKVDENNTFMAGELMLLKSAAVYGANASGKSNLVRALAFMRQFVLTSSKESQINEPIQVIPFRLHTASESEPSLFQVIFLMEGIRYRYGFEVDQNHVVAEWLYHTAGKYESRIFLRDEQGIKVSRDYKEGKKLPEKTRPNALFVSVVAQFNGILATKILNWFQQLFIVSGLDDNAYMGYTFNAFAKTKLQPQILELITKLDLGIDDIIYREVDKQEVAIPNGMPEELRNFLIKNFSDTVIYIKMLHRKWDADGKLSEQVEFDFSEESNGTQKLFNLSGPILNALENGLTLVVDEMEARLHPLITRALINLFHSVETNPENAQLIFTTHDTNLLSNKIFRRDQIWFIEKDKKSSSHLYSLAELKVRNDASFESDYVEGRYGAVPFLGDIRQFFVSPE